MADEIVVRSPFDGHEIGTIPAHTQTDLDQAVEQARQTKPLASHERAEILELAARAISENSEDFARTISEEAAKPLKAARVEATRCRETFIAAATAARELAGEMIPMDATAIGKDKLGYTLRVPIGIVGAITPFNFPLNLVAHKIAPAIAAGCPIIVKPASQTPFSCLKLVELLSRIGLPENHLQVLTGSGSEVGNALVEHPDIAMITFTGSAEVGWNIAAHAPKKRVRLELGNNTPVIVHNDSEWTVAAEKISVGGFSFAGQSCISAQRVYVQKEISQQFIDLLVTQVSKLKVGNPLDDTTDVSVLISPDATNRVKQWIDEALDQGAKLIHGGEISDGMLEPTILGEVTSDMRVCREEVFGPVVAIQSYKEFEEAIVLSNDSKYGLQAGVFTTDLALALQASRELTFGAVLINEIPTWRADHMPYGGVKESGNTKEGPHYAVREMTTERLVVIQS